MIVIKESLTIEYESAGERELHVEQMIKDGYILKNQYSQLDIFFHPPKEYIVAEFDIKREGHVGRFIK